MISLFIVPEPVIRQYRTRSRKLRKQPSVVIADFCECGRHDSLRTYTAITMALKLYPIPFFRRNSICYSRFNFIYKLPLSFSSCFFFECCREGGQSFVQNDILRPGVSLQLRAGVGVGQILATPAPTPTPARIVDSHRLQLRSRLRLRSPAPKRIIYS